MASGIGLKADRQYEVFLYITPYNHFCQTNRNCQKKDFTKMIKDQTAIIHKYCKEQFEKQNILKYIRDTVKNSQNLNHEMIRKCVLQSDYWAKASGTFVKKGQIISLSIANLQTNQKDMKLLECILQAFTQVKYVSLWNCNVDKKTFEVLGKVSWEGIGLIDTSIGRNMGDFLQVLNLKNIKYLHISSEPIGNKSIKTMMKMEWPSLRQFYCQNIDLTTDFVRTLTKLSHGLQHIKLLGQSNAISTVFVKQIIKIYSMPTMCFLQLTPFYSADDSYYLCWIAKSRSTFMYLRLGFLRQIYIQYPVSIKVQLPEKVKKIACFFVKVIQKYQE